MDTDLVTCNSRATQNIINYDSTMLAYLQNSYLIKNFLNFSDIFLQEIENSSQHIKNVSDFLIMNQDALINGSKYYF